MIDEHSLTTLVSDTFPESETVHDSVKKACARIAPTWPLDRFIAVNPLWNSTDRPLRDVAAELRSLSGARMLMPRSYYREAHRDGRLTDEHLAEAVARSKTSVSLNELRRLLAEDASDVPRRSRVTDVIDAQRDLTHQVSWDEFVTSNVSQYCAAFFDEGQATFGPNRDGGLYESWRRQSTRERGPALLMGLPTFQAEVHELPHAASAMVEAAVADLGIAEHERASYFSSLLLDLNGWASWCTYRKWTANLAGGDDVVIEDLLAIRLAWEWLLFRTAGDGSDTRWRDAMNTWPRVDADARDAQEHEWLLQEALEIAWQSSIIPRIPAGLTTSAPQDVSVQAAFCIDVRSEVLRRALEAETPAIQTLGFAGFFGLPVDYQPLGANEGRPQLPGLLAASLRVTDTGLDANAAAARRERLAGSSVWKTFKSGSVSMFMFVEAMGLTYAAKLLGDSFSRKKNLAVDTAGLSPEDAAQRKPRLTQLVNGEAVTLDARCDLAAGILRGMSLTHNFARLVLLAGHGSESRNNPHAAGLDCGACCGQSGEVNARAAAALFNEPDVREGLIARGITIPATTHFLGGLHNTTTDEVTLYDTGEAPATHAADVSALKDTLRAAGDRARQERAQRFGFTDAKGRGLLTSLRNRGRDWSQVRPEWGLVNNAAFIVAPREHCRHLDMEGRVFLHEYRPDEDTDFKVLEQIMTAPMVVSHWINFQYYASTVDNERYGSGNKILHNVVGGHLGVFEGNGGDLRTGLAMQSLNDGERWVHTPLRLSVFLEAPRDAIDAVLAKHAHVRALVDNGWLHLFQIDADERSVYGRRAVGWTREGNAVASP